MWIEFSFDTVMFVNMDCMKFCVSECNENALFPKLPLQQNSTSEWKSHHALFRHVLVAELTLSHTN